ncbi:MAG: hypothetical protein ABIT08_08850, partial [Bacteroidia bacterium]
LQSANKYIPLKKFNGLPPKKVNRHNDSILPIFKINFSGDILYGNYASLNLLHELGVTANRRLSGKFISQYLPVREKNINTDIVIASHDSELLFSVVSFEEAGYIGFYAYQVTTKI